MKHILCKKKKKSKKIKRTQFTAFCSAFGSVYSEDKKRNNQSANAYHNTLLVVFVAFCCANDVLHKCMLL